MDETRGLKPIQMVAIAFVLGAVCAIVFFMATGAGSAPFGKQQESQEQSASQEQAAPQEQATKPEQGAESGQAADKDAAEPATSPEETRTILASWNTESESYKSLVSFVESVCDPDGDEYLAPEQRVATFDMDGTILCEKAPIYIDQSFAAWHVLEDDTYEAPADLVAAVEEMKDEIDAGIVPKDHDLSLNDVLAQSYVGRTPEELMSDVERFASTQKAVGFTGMTYAQSFYKPMLEVLEYLRANDFDVWMVSACERLVARQLAVGYAGFTPDHVIASDLLLKAEGQGDEDGLDYTFTQDDKLLISGGEVLETGKTNKVIAIQNSIGRRPVLSFGNSSGDFAMLNYAMQNPEHKGLGFYVLCDDTEREYGDLEKAAEQKEVVDKEGWQVISMADDWKTIYGEGVERTELPGSATELQAAA